MVDPVKDSLVLINGWGAEKNIWYRLTDALKENFDFYYIDLHDERFAIDVLCPELFSDIGGDKNDEDIVNLNVDFNTCLNVVNDDKNVEHYIATLIETIANEIPRPSHLLGWSLGGMLATKLAVYSSEKGTNHIEFESANDEIAKPSVSDVFPIKSLVTLASNVSFVKGLHWPYAMEEKIFNNFYDGFLRSPKKAAMRFLGLQVQSVDVPKKAVSELKKFSVLLNDSEDKKISEFDLIQKERKLINTKNNGDIQHFRDLVLLKVLSYIDNLEVLKDISIPTNFLFFDHDSLVPAKAAEPILKSVSTLGLHHVSVDVIRDTCHAGMLFNAEPLLDRLHRFYNDKNFTPVEGARKSLSCSMNERDQKDVFFKDKNKIARSFSLAARSYDSVASLQREVADRLVKMQSVYSGLWGDLGCGTGYCFEKVLEKYPQTSFLGTDIAYGMLCVAKEKYKDIGRDKKTNFCVGDIESLPVASQTFDGLISSLSVQWSDDLTRVFNEAYRVLKPGGVFLCSSLISGTLKELNQAWYEADPNQVHVNNFKGALDYIDTAENQGFELIQFVQESKVLEYQQPMELMRELKALGAHNVNSGNRQGLTGKNILKKVCLAYEKFRVVEKNTEKTGSAEGKSFIPASYQVVYLVLKKTN